MFLLGRMCLFFCPPHIAKKREKQKKTTTKMVKAQSNSQPVRLYVKGTFTGYKRGRRNTYHHTTLLKIDGANDDAAGKFYLGKRVAYIYKAPTSTSASKFRVVWGKVTRTHGNNGLVRAKFARNLPSQAIGSSVRVMLYPTTV